MLFSGSRFHDIHSAIIIIVRAIRVGGREETYAHNMANNNE
jgi:hypothetical protein